MPLDYTVKYCILILAATGIAPKKDMKMRQTMINFIECNVMSDQEITHLKNMSHADILAMVEKNLTFVDIEGEYQIETLTRAKVLTSYPVCHGSDTLVGGSDGNWAWGKKDTHQVRIGAPAVYEISLFTKDGEFHSVGMVRDKDVAKGIAQKINDAAKK